MLAAVLPHFITSKPPRQPRGWALCSAVPPPPQSQKTLPQFTGVGILRNNPNSGRGSRGSAWERGIKKAAAPNSSMCCELHLIAPEAETLPDLLSVRRWTVKSKPHSLDVLCWTKPGGWEWIIPPSTHFSLPSLHCLELALYNKAFSSCVEKILPQTAKTARHRWNTHV